MSDNPYQASNYGAFTTADAVAVDERAAFLQKTYLHLLGAILAFAAIDAFIITAFHDQLLQIVPKLMGGFTWLLLLGGFMLVSYVADRWAHSGTSRQTQYAGLATYGVAEALLFVPLLFIANEYFPGVIQSAGLVTAVVFGGLTLACFITRTDFSFLRWGLVVAGFVALALIVASLTLGFSLGVWFSIAMVALACGSILYNTSNVLHHYNTQQYVAASLALFSSVALLLWYVIQIFMHMDSD
jgi:FtsH-binding integral membrane protein